MTRIGTALLPLCACALIASHDPSASVTVAPLASATVLDGESPHLLIAGLRPGELATVHAFRRVSAYGTTYSTSSPC